MKYFDKGQFELARAAFLQAYALKKHPAILPIGETAAFRIEKDTMKLRVPEANGKEQQYTVVSMTMRSDVPERTAASDAKP